MITRHAWTDIWFTSLLVLVTLMCAGILLRPRPRPYLVVSVATALMLGWMLGLLVWRLVAL